MPLKHLYADIPLEVGEIVTLPQPLQHRLAKVLRLGQGDRVGLFNGQNGLWAAEIADKSCKTAHILHQELSQPSTSGPTLVLGLPKREAWESALRQATELGVSAIQPLVTEYAQRSAINAQRAHTLLVEAAEQSEALNIPTLLPILTLPNWLKTLNQACLWGHARGESMAHGVKANHVLVGPEGGFSPAEEALLEAHAYIKPTHLPTGILRTDTAVVALLVAARL